ncbi:MAG: CoB--CoM heterodisulfide reductase iron-sulfur subunit B family protein [Proteobacteria bacterium]|nr:CoB--CoM heterodisulfide reductase iron-sulfur subunit B family protein [Pseudomonadota bacterium]
MACFMYAGCSLEGPNSGSHYLVSLEACAEPLGLEFHDLEDWSCCGASISYVGGNELSVKVLAARNLALAQAQGGYDIVAPCSSCYIVLNKVGHELEEDPELLARVNEVLAEGGLEYRGGIKTRHVLDVLYHDVGPDKIAAAVTRPLGGMKVAGYVGCQTVRPYGEYDSAERPVVMDRLIEAVGAEAVDFPRRMRCCGSGIFLTELENCSTLVRDILHDAVTRDAKLVATACPMCQMNLEVYQSRINKLHNAELDVPVVFITQLMAAAFGLNLKKAAALNRNLGKARKMVAEAVA